MSSGLHPGRDALRATLDLFEVGLGLMRQNLRRADPVATDQEIDQRLQQWLRHRPGAEFGDCQGPLRDLNGRPE
jgi:Rv0078B-related antitoxin